MRKLKTLLTGAVACGIAATAMAAPEVYTIDSAHTYPSFEVPHQGLSWWRGKFDMTTGKIWLDREKQTGKMDITIDTNTANFGMKAMDQRAKNQDWFHVEKYPTATYKSDSITFKNGTPVEVNGQLTLRGITKPLKLEIREFRCMDHPMLKREICGADAHAAFDRRDFGMTQSIFNNDGRVRLQIAVEATKGDAPLPPPPPGGPPADGPPVGAPPR